MPSLLQYKYINYIKKFLWRSNIRIPFTRKTEITGAPFTGPHTNYKPLYNPNYRHTTNFTGTLNPCRSIIITGAHNFLLALLLSYNITGALVYWCTTSHQYISLPAHMMVLFFFFYLFFCALNAMCTINLH